MIQIIIMYVRKPMLIGLHINVNHKHGQVQYVLIVLLYVLDYNCNSLHFNYSLIVKDKHDCKIYKLN